MILKIAPGKGISNATVSAQLVCAQQVRRALPEACR